MMRDFLCASCGVVEDLVDSKALVTECPSCGASVERVMSTVAVFTEIVPTTKTSKKRKAGYVHTHGDRPKTPGKIQVSVP